MSKSFLLITLLILSVCSVSAETAPAVRVHGVIQASTPCALANQCERNAASLVCIQQITPLAGVITISNSKSSVTTSLIGGFKTKLKPGRYDVKFKRFDGVASNCTMVGNNLICSKIENSDLYSQNIEVKSRARVTPTKRFVSLLAAAAPCK